MYRISKEFVLDASHQLPRHEGKCANVHGHTYTIIVSLQSPTLLDEESHEGFVMDFGDLKQIMAPIISAMDHAFIAAGDEPIVTALEKHGSKIYRLGKRSTAENIAHHIFQLVSDKLLHQGAVEVSGIEVWETPKSKAAYLR